MGEGLETLNLKELQQLEQQLESSLKHIRSRKNQLMAESISELQRKERSLQEENKVLQKELAEKQKVHRQQVQWEQAQQPQTSSFSSSFMMREAPPTVVAKLNTRLPAQKPCCEPPDRSNPIGLSVLARRRQHV